jgi:hypothetical protein
MSGGVSLGGDLHEKFGEGALDGGDPSVDFSLILEGVGDGEVVAEVFKGDVWAAGDGGDWAVTGSSKEYMWRLRLTQVDILLDK